MLFLCMGWAGLAGLGFNVVSLLGLGWARNKFGLGLTLVLAACLVACLPVCLIAFLLACFLSYLPVCLSVLEL